MSPSTRWHSSVPRETFSPLISNAGKSESIWWGTVFPSSTGCSQRGPFLSRCIQRTELWAEWRRQEEAEGAADRILRGHYTQTDPTNHIMDFMKKPANRSLEIFSLWIPHWPTGTSCAPCAQPHSPPSCSWMCVLAAEGSERQLSQRASELVQKASQSLWAWERPQVAPPLGNQMRHC